MRTKGNLYIFYVTVKSRTNQVTTLKQVSTCERLAILAAMKKVSFDNVSSIQVGQGIPKKGSARAEHLKRSKAAKAAHKRRKEADIMTYDGLNRIDKEKPGD